MRLIKDKNSENIALAREYFRKICGKSKPLFKLFKTHSHGYLYDTGTNKLLKCNDKIFNTLEKLNSNKIDPALNECISDYGVEDFLQMFNDIKDTIEK